MGGQKQQQKKQRRQNNAISSRYSSFLLPQQQATGPATAVNNRHRHGKAPTVDGEKRAARSLGGGLIMNASEIGSSARGFKGRDEKGWKGHLRS